MLPLNDPRWEELEHRGWVHGERYIHDPDAPFVPDELAKLSENASGLERFRTLWPYLCSEGTTWAAAYAAAPYVVALARQVPHQQRFEYLCFLGLVVMCSCPDEGESFAIKPYLMEGYRRALTEALPLLLETLAGRHNATETRYLLAAVAALKGHPRLAEVLEDLECIHQECPGCGELVYPEQLQRVAEDTEPDLE